MERTEVLCLPGQYPSPGVSFSILSREILYFEVPKLTPLMADIVVKIFEESLPREDEELFCNNMLSLLKPLGVSKIPYYCFTFQMD